jgi:hypothetical protein
MYLIILGIIDRAISKIAASQRDRDAEANQDD